MLWGEGGRDPGTGWANLQPCDHACLPHNHSQQVHTQPLAAAQHAGPGPHHSGTNNPLRAATAWLPRSACSWGAAWLHSGRRSTGWVGWGAPTYGAGQRRGSRGSSRCPAGWPRLGIWSVGDGEVCKEGGGGGGGGGRGEATCDMSTLGRAILPNSAAHPGPLLSMRVWCITYGEGLRCLTKQSGRQAA